MSGQRAPWRLPRAAVVAGIVLGLAAGAHVLAGGLLPAPPVMAALAAVVTLTAMLLAGVKMTAPVLTAYLSTGQFLLHGAFSALSARSTSGSGPGRHAHDGAPLQSHAPDAVLHVHLATDDSPAMTGLHLVATLTTALLLARAEDALWALAAWLCPLPGLTLGRIPPAFRQLVRCHGTRRQRWRALGPAPARGPPPCPAAVSVPLRHTSETARIVETP